MAKQKEVFVQIGVTALREIDGSFQPSQPLYIKVPESEISTETNLYSGTEKMLKDASGIFLDLYKRYVGSGGSKELSSDKNVQATNTDGGA